VIGAAQRRFTSLRSFVRGWPGGHHVWRVGIAVLGLLVVIAGIVMLVLPGPGWLVIFVGFGILATEFPWAHGVLALVRRQLASWASWVRSRSRWVWVAFGVVCLALAGIVVWLTLM
jgi:uncharacterized protein (TIGR02611 family)